MRQEIENAGNMTGVKLVTFNSPLDLCNYVTHNKHARYRAGDAPKDWAGGTFEQYADWSAIGDPSYARKAEKYVDQFANLAIRDYTPTLEYNTQVGILDYHAAMAGDPACMFGPTVAESDQSPINVYVDAWTSAAVPARAMEMRGIAVLALALALSVFRPVRVKLVAGMKHTPTSTDAIVTIDVPTAPMDLSIASWMLGSPTMFRMGLLSSIWGIANSSAFCGIPPLSDSRWQRQDMGDWLAKRENVNDVVFLPMMYGGGEWADEAKCLAWVKEQIARFVE